VRGKLWDGHELFSLDIVGKLKWDDRFPAVYLLEEDRGKGVYK